ncbi:UbiH/UbiF/VisC/COQ6 family ubiquinone biosynthesis hydroxylase [Gilvimarinus xylanilyticus]|uniref:UbiH/UbiF/VisC/COQ6 family ubiquinone biosynthesis hydroxylase n=1 Tax=Gilvimarinus xylanilyticus TaxID=2944139 RepID=A0A9X2I4P3_9GAMM|nr:UbiH/UbiF/VisC/COQ6 family ubiquinone biosynthesis hydroxylase [Gilvimarinus xylanilyticus]MCP8899961.1 UbiH/UbiF/VisC/COQ6 family ubiquinone biosynthesis hydroxylase [Gilvimarinus xylanilyticus]
MPNRRMGADTAFDLIVVGAGIVGTTLALRLSQGTPGLKVALISPKPSERGAPEETFDPRVVALTAASRELLTGLNIWPSVERVRACPYTAMHVWDGEGGGEIDFSAAELGVEALGHIVENRLLVASLERELETQGVTWISGQVTALEHEGDAVAGVLLADGTEVRAALTLAADGARSALRDMAGLAVREWSYGQSAIVTTVKTTQSHNFTARQRFMHTGPLAFLPLVSAPGECAPRYSSIVWSADEPLAQSLMALSDADFGKRLGRDFEYRLGEIEQVAKRYCLPLTQRHARRYTCPGFALVGDAAHSIHPLAGQGVNLGLLDVAALAGEIERARERGVALQHDSILARYERARRGHNLTMMAAMESFKRLFGARDLRLLWLRNRALSAADSLPLLKNTLAREAMGLSLS